MSLDSGVASAISWSEASLSNGFTSGSLKLDNCSLNMSRLAWPLSGNRSSSLYMFDLSGLVCLFFIHFIIIGKSLLKGDAHSRGALI